MEVTTSAKMQWSSNTRYKLIHGFSKSWISSPVLTRYGLLFCEHIAMYDVMHVHVYDSGCKTTADRVELVWTGIAWLSRPTVYTTTIESVTDNKHMCQRFGWWEGSGSTHMSQRRP